MSTSNKLATAALAGLLSTTFLAAGVAHAADMGAKAEKVETTKAEKEKHACKGLNSCKGNSPDGKNSCKGKSDCSTLDKK